MNAKGRWVAHRPKFYRYRVGEPRRFKALWNYYPGHPPIGAALVIGHYAYCVKWADLPTTRKRRTR